MFFFLDESWQDNRHKVGVISAINIPSNQINRFADIVHGFVRKYIVQSQGEFKEIKGTNLVNKRYYKLEADFGYCRNLSLARELLYFIKNEGCKVFASVCFDKAMINLDCPNEEKLDLPFRFLFERIASFVEIDHPGKIATIVMDDRSHVNSRIASTVTRFFSRHPKARQWNIHRTPFFSISDSDVGIQLSDLVCRCLGLHYSGERYANDLYKLVMDMEYRYTIGKKEFSSIRKINPPRQKR